MGDCAFRQKSRKMIKVPLCRERSIIMYKKNDLNCIEETTYTLCVQGNHRNEVLATFKDKQSYETFIQLHYDNEEVKT